MSVYRTLLEEDENLGGLLDDNNSMDMSDIDKVVEDHDANADEQKAAHNAKFGDNDGGGPDDDVDSIMDETAIAIAEAEMNFNKIMMAVGIWESTEMASGREPIYENALTDYIKKAKDWVVNFFKKVWDVLKRYAKNIASVFHTNKGLADKYKTQITQGYDAYKNRKTDKGKSVAKSWEFTDRLDALFNKDYWTKVKVNIGDTSSGRYNLISADAVESYRKKFRSEIIGKDYDGDDFRGELKKAIYGEEKKEYYMKPDEIIRVLSSGKENKQVKKAMDDAKKQYKSAISKLNEAEKKAIRNNNTTNDNKDSSNYNKQVSEAAMNKAIYLSTTVKNELADVQTARAVLLSAVRTRMVQARAFAHAYIGAYNRYKHKGFQKESAGFMSTLGDIELI